jgi:mycoredoxin
MNRASRASNARSALVLSSSERPHPGSSTGVRCRESPDLRPDRDRYGPRVVANKTKLIVASVALWCLPGIAFALSMVLSGNVWVAAAASALGIVAARSILRRSVVALTNDQSVDAGEHAVGGRIEAVEVFWRPGCPFTEGLGRRLAEAGVPTNLRNIWEDPCDAAIVRSIAGGAETVPTLIIGPVALVNPSATLVLATLRAHAPHLLDANH